MENYHKKSFNGIFWSHFWHFGQNQALNGKSLMAKTTNKHVPPSLTKHTPPFKTFHQCKCSQLTAPIFSPTIPFRYGIKGFYLNHIFFCTFCHWHVIKWFVWPPLDIFWLFWGLGLLTISSFINRVFIIWIANASVYWVYAR